VKAKIISLGIVLLVILVYAGGCFRAGSWLVKKDEPAHADAIIILMGSLADRVLQAADLYLDGRAKKVIIVEANMDGYNSIKARGVYFQNRTEQARDAVIELGIPYDSVIVLPGKANSTQVEALIIRKYLENKPAIDTILLVTSAPHSRRASLIFKSAFKKVETPVVVISSPSSYTIFDAENWWKSKEGLQTVMFEYLKLANFVLSEKRKLK